MGKSTLNEVLSVAIDDFDPEAYYDGYEQIRKESVTIFYENYACPEHTPEDVMEAYQDSFAGWFEDGEAFAYDLAEDLVDLRNLNWPLNCIDWEKAANELLMSDYWEEDGYYFRS